MPADRTAFDVHVRLMGERAPQAQWCAAGIGAQQLVVNEWSIAAGGHSRACPGGNVRIDHDRLAPSNADLIARAAGLCENCRRPVATSAQTREILGLRLYPLYASAVREWPIALRPVRSARPRYDRAS